MSVTAGTGSIRPTLPSVPSTYDWEKFRADGHKLIDFIADFHQNMCKNPDSVPVTPNSQQQQQNESSSAAASSCSSSPSITPGFLADRSDLRRHLEVVNAELEKRGDAAALSQEQLQEQWKKSIVPGLVQWQHPHFYAYFPAIVSPQVLLSDLLADAVMTPGFTWAACPAQTELEQLVMNYLAEKAFCFHPSNRFSWGKGGSGVIQACATTSTITAMAAAKMRALDRCRSVPVGAVTAGGTANSASPLVAEEDGKNAARLVAYHTDQAHFCVEKACKVLGIQHVRKLKTAFNKDLENFPVDPQDLAEAIANDKAKGLLPFFVSGNFGATSTVAVDPLLEVGRIAKSNHCWFHVDAAYAGCALLVPEVREKQFGGDAVFELVDTICINGSKWLGLMMNASFLFSADANSFPRALAATGVYLTQNAGVGSTGAELKDFQLGMGRNFRAYKVFAALQTTGVRGWRATVERHFLLAQELDRKLRGDSRFEVVTKTNFGLVVFRLRMVDPSATLKLAEQLNATGKIYLITTSTHMGGAAIRVAFCHPQCGYEDVESLFAMICAETDTLVPKS